MQHLNLLKGLLSFAFSNQLDPSISYVSRSHCNVNFVNCEIIERNKKEPFVTLASFNGSSN